MSPLQNNYLVEIRFTWFSCEILVKIVLEVELLEPLVNRKATRHPSGFILFTCLYHFFFAFIKDTYVLVNFIRLQLELHSVYHFVDLLRTSIKVISFPLCLYLFFE